MNPDRRRALSEFYREEFLRHLQFLESGGFVGSDRCEAMNRAYQRLLGGLDDICCRSDFPVVAETLLQSFDALTGLSRLDTRRGH